MLGRWLLFFIACGAAWTSHARADFNSQEAVLAGEPPAEPVPPAEPAQAAPPTPQLVFRSRPPGYGDRPFHVELITGLATTVGLLGVAGEVNLGNPLSLGAGIGTNILGTDWEAHARWRPIYQVNTGGTFFSALTLEAAFASSLNTNTNASLIPDIDCNSSDIHGGCYDPPVVPQRVYWAQGELGWEGMFRSGLTLRVASGAARELGSPSWQCQVSGQIAPCHSLPAALALVLTFAIGYAF